MIQHRSERPVQARTQRPYRRFLALFVTAVVATIGAVAMEGPTEQTVVSAAPDTSRYLPTAPTRVVDTRSGSGGRLQPGATRTWQVVTSSLRSAASVRSSDHVTAVVVNVTMVDAARQGYVTVWPAGQSRPGVSSLNAEGPGHTVASLVTVPVDANGRIQVYAHGGGHVLVDVQGLYVRADLATEGRFVPLTPRRAIDTRSSGGTLAAGTTRTVDLRSHGVPASARAAVLNLTSTQASSRGFLTMWSGLGGRPTASNLNVPPDGRTIANQVIVPVHQGRVTVYSSVRSHVIVDVSGYYTGLDAALSDAGLFVPVSPVRLLDTRSSAGLMRAAGLATASTAARISGPAAAVTMTVTATQTATNGYLTVWPSGSARPVVSTLNAVRADQTLANHAQVRVGSTGSAALFTTSGSHLIADLTGWFTMGSPTTPTQPPTTTTPATTVAPTPTTTTTKPPTSPTTTTTPATTTTTTAPTTTTTTTEPDSTSLVTGPHSFLYTYESTYARWNPCAPIRYVVDETVANAQQREYLDWAIAQLAAHSGLVFEFVGTIEDGSSGDPVSGAEAVFAFTTQERSPQLGGAVGIGGGRYTVKDGVARVVDGFALFDVAVGSGIQMQNLLLHEIGHMVGLGHVDYKSEIMYPYLQSKDQFGNGDREGLWWLGAEQGCIGSGSLKLASSDDSEPDELITRYLPSVDAHDGQDDHGDHDAHGHESGGPAHADHDHEHHAEDDHDDHDDPNDEVRIVSVTDGVVEVIWCVIEA